MSECRGIGGVCIQGIELHERTQEPEESSACGAEQTGIMGRETNLSGPHDLQNSPKR